MSCVWLLVACSPSRQVPQQLPMNPMLTLIKDTNLQHAHVGILVQEANSSKVLYNHQEAQYFVPASNTKLWTMYAGMKYLGDSLLSGHIASAGDGRFWLKTAGDPTLLHPDFEQQPLADQLRRASEVLWTNPTTSATPYGNGWSWNDYDATYMAPRSSMPLFGNEVAFSWKNGSMQTNPAAASVLLEGSLPATDTGMDLYRPFDDAWFTPKTGTNKSLTLTLYPNPNAVMAVAAAYFGNRWQVADVPPQQAWQAVYSQPTDSMLKPLMHFSDNFFAEQTLLMIGHRWWGDMNDSRVMDSLLRTDLAGMPQKPRWADGSGLSRYNLFTPADYVWLLQKMQQEFPMARLKAILPGANEGTLTNYYKGLEGRLFAKTGTLSGVVSLSGYLTAASGRLLLFSVLVNNHNGSAAAVRRAVEQFLKDVAAAH